MGDGPGKSWGTCYLEAGGLGVVVVRVVEFRAGVAFWLFWLFWLGGRGGGSLGGVCF